MIIQARDLTKTYRVYKKQPGLSGALRGLIHREFEELSAANAVSFSIEEGEIIGFLGPNGAGKTTTLKMLAGLIHPTSGHATVLGFTPWERKNAFRRQIALVLGQKNQLWWDLPARESLTLNRVIYGLDEAAAKRSLHELCEILDVTPKLDVMVRELSLGERMKFELIAALLHQPRVLFLDEPTIGLDVVSQQKVREFLQTYTRQKNITTILTSHYMQDIQELCRRVIIIDHGKLFFDGDLKEIISRFSSQKNITLTFTHPTSADEWAPFGEIITHSGVSVQIRVPRDRVPDLCRKATLLPQLEDINISEVPVEEIIRKLFTERKEA